MADDKPHWTQTPEGRAKMSRIHKLAWKRKREHEHSNGVKRHAGKPSKKTQAAGEIAPDVIAYALGRIEGFIEYFARSANISEITLATKLGEILSGKVRR